MAGTFGQVQLDRDDWRRFNRAVTRSVDRELPRRIGQANKAIGARFVDQWLMPKPDPRAVGQGAGATVRPSATRREVLLRVGGVHRAGRTPQEPWGKRRGGDLHGAPPRPDIRASAGRHEDEIREAWLEAISDAMRPAFHDTEP